jgi:hypothetical protein
MKLIPKY